MAIYKLFPEKDSTLYTQNADMNTGLDEILEASTYLLNDAAQTSRFLFPLIKFSQHEINRCIHVYIWIRSKYYKLIYQQASSSSFIKFIKLASPTQTQEIYYNTYSNCLFY